MKRVEAEVNIYLTKHMTIDLEDGEDLDEKVWRIVVGWESQNDEKYEKLLLGARLESVDTEEMSLKQKVRMAINRFDPYVLMPGHPDGAPLDEYDCLSDRIYRKLTPAYTVEQIGELIGQEFKRSFEQDFPLSETIYVAQWIYEYIHD